MNCRICNSKFFKTPLVRYENMPSVAQHLPDERTLKDDVGVDLEVYQCSNCGLVQLNNDPVPYYREVIRASAFSEEMGNYREKQFTNFVEKYSLKGKKIIEIGCGRGEYLSLMQRCGVDCYGLEYSDMSVTHCRDNKLKVSRGFIDAPNYTLDNAPFDAFFIMNYLEHLPDPNSTLKGISNNLASGGIGLVEVPNFDMILQRKLFAEFTTDHLFYFTKDTLTNTLRLNGFDVIECGEIWNGYIISAVVRCHSEPFDSAQDKLREESHNIKEILRCTQDDVRGCHCEPAGRSNLQLNLQHFHDHQSRLTKDIHEYIDRFEKGNVAIWGAGHQAFALISLTGIADKIKYVVDSATFKQGKFTPATHIRIVSPDTLVKDPVDAIIVMAGGYSDEVAKIVREKFARTIDVSILRDFGLEAI